MPLSFLAHLFEGILIVKIRKPPFLVLVQSKAHLFCPAPCALTTSTSLHRCCLHRYLRQNHFARCLLLFSPIKRVLPPIAGSGAECGDLKVTVPGCYVRRGGRAGSVHGACCWGRKMWTVCREQLHKNCVLWPYQ